MNMVQLEIILFHTIVYPYRQRRYIYTAVMAIGLVWQSNGPDVGASQSLSFASCSI